MPQGSVLGTLLFLIYINGLIAEPSFQAKLFAGNRIIFTELMSTADQLKLNSYLDQIRKWLEMAMALNLEKTVCTTVLNQTRSFTVPTTYQLPR